MVNNDSNTSLFASNYWSEYCTVRDCQNDQDI